jgi:hypothetical protein
VQADAAGDETTPLDEARAAFRRHRDVCVACSWMPVQGVPQRLCSEGRRLWASVEVLESRHSAGAQGEDAITA